MSRVVGNRKARILTLDGKVVSRHAALDAVGYEETNTPGGTDGVNTVVTAERHGAHAQYNPNDKYDVQSHVPVVNADGTWDPTDVNFHFKTSYVVSISGTLEQFHNSVVGAADDDADDDDPARKPLQVKYSLEAIEKIYKTSVLNNIDRYIQPDALPYNTNYEQLYLVASRTIARDGGGLPFPVGIAWVETDGDEKLIGTFDAANRSYGVSGTAVYDLVLPNGSGPSDYRKLDYEHVLQSGVVATHGTESAANVMVGISVYPAAPGFYSVPFKSPLIVNGWIADIGTLTAIPGDAYIVPTDVVDTAVRTSTFVSNQLNRTNATNKTFVALRLDGFAASDKATDVFENTWLATASADEQEAALARTYTINFFEEDVFSMPIKDDPNACLTVPVSKLDDARALIATLTGRSGVAAHRVEGVAAIGAEAAAPATRYQ